MTLHAKASTWSLRLALALLLLLGAALHVRLLRTDAGLPYLHHWDEPYTASAALQTLKTGDFRPYFYDYPALLTYACVAVDGLHYLSLMKKWPGEPGYLQDLSALEPRGEDGWLWQTSHPSFYRWNRAFVALLGTLTVFLLFLVGRAIHGNAAGLLAAFMLAGFGFHVKHSAFVTPNVPVAAFVLLALLFSIYYLQQGRLGYLVAAAASAGLACSTKYNAAVVLLLPAAALFLRPASGRWPRLLLVLALPPLVFLLVNPFALIDLPTFISHVGHDVRNYGVVEGTGAVQDVFTRVGAVIQPGWEHFRFQVGAFRTQVGLPALLVAGLGCVLALVRSRVGWLCLLFPLLYTGLMVQQRVNFHRNLLAVYPFLALFAALGLLWIAARVRPRRGAAGPGPREEDRRTGWVAALLCLLIVGPGHARTWREAHHEANAVETRSRAIDLLNTQPGMEGRAAVGVAHELRYHPFDLARIQGRYQVEPHEQLLKHIHRFDYLLVGRYQSHAPAQHAEDARLNALVPEDRVVATVGWGTPTLRDVYSVNPDVLVVEGYWNEPIRPQELSVNSFAGGFVEDPAGTMHMTEARPCLTPPITLPGGRYRLRLDAMGSPLAGEAPRVQLLLGDRLLEEWTAGEAFRGEEFEFHVAEDQEERLGLRLVNGAGESFDAIEATRLAAYVSRVTGRAIQADAARGVTLQLRVIAPGTSRENLFHRFLDALEAAGYSAISRGGGYEVVPLPGTTPPASTATDRAQASRARELWIRNIALAPVRNGNASTP